MLKNLFTCIVSLIFVNTFAQSDTIFIEELDTVYLETKTVIIDSVVYIDRNQIKTETSLFFYSGISNPQFSTDISTLRSSYSDSLNTAFSNFIGFKNGILIKQRINKINVQIGIDYSYTRFKFSHIDLDSLPYSCHNSIRGLQFSTLFGYKIAQMGKISITPLVGLKLATIQKVSGLTYNPDEVNFRSYLSEIATFNKSYFITNLTMQFIYNTQKMNFGIAPDFNYHLSKLTTSESKMNFKGWDLGLMALIGYSF